MNFRSVSQLSSQVLAWAKKLPPEIEVVVGVPRSGLLAANFLALYRNLPLTDIEGLLDGRCLASGYTRDVAIEGAPSKGGTGEGILARPREILIVDDSVFSGGTMQRIRERVEAAKLPHRVRYAAVYVKPGHTDAVDFHCEVLHAPRVFEWNVLHSHPLTNACLDMDGVLCHDPVPEENDDGERYLNFLRAVRPLLRPTAKIGWIVTSRLEKYRAETEAWLHRHGVEYGELVMLDYADGATRRRFNTHSAFKADVFRNTGAELFIESSVRQAYEIANLAEKDVLCIDTMQMIRPGGAPLPRPVFPQQDRHAPALSTRVLRRVLPPPVRSALKRWRAAASMIP